MKNKLFNFISLISIVLLTMIFCNDIAYSETSKDSLKVNNNVDSVQSKDNSSNVINKSSDVIETDKVKVELNQKFKAFDISIEDINKKGNILFFSLIIVFIFFGIFYYLLSAKQKRQNTRC